MKLEKTVESYRINKQTDIDARQKKIMYVGVSVLEERAFNKGGTSIRYWM